MSGPLLVNTRVLLFSIRDLSQYSYTILCLRPFSISEAISPFLCLRPFLIIIWSLRLSTLFETFVNIWNYLRVRFVTLFSLTFLNIWRYLRPETIIVSVWDPFFVSDLSQYLKSLSWTSFSEPFHLRPISLFWDLSQYIAWCYFNMSGPLLVNTRVLLFSIRDLSQYSYTILCLRRFSVSEAISPFLCLRPFLILKLFETLYTLFEAFVNVLNYITFESQIWDRFLCLHGLRPFSIFRGIWDAFFEFFVRPFSISEAISDLSQYPKLFETFELLSGYDFAFEFKTFLFV